MSCISGRASLCCNASPRNPCISTATAASASWSTEIVCLGPARCSRTRSCSGTPRIEIIVVGTGDRTERLQPGVLQAMRQRGIAVEVQDTPNACATFNFLCHEGRVTGAALIPPPGGTVLTTLAQAAE
ncbi:NADH dehydrogenase [ubiquinone] 1 alpha subcomplex assembly factor 3 isoform X2 [Prionailurus iriomotensis]